MFSRENQKDVKEEIVEQIICEKYNSYYRIAYSYVHNDADASDIVQEGAYKAMKSSSSLRNTEFAGTWVYRIMMNEIFKFLDSNRLSSFEGEKIKEPQTEDDYEDIDLIKALAELSPKDRAVIQLKFFEDQKLKKIADILGENINTVKSRYISKW